MIPNETTCTKTQLPIVRQHLQITTNVIKENVLICQSRDVIISFIRFFTV